MHLIEGFGAGGAPDVVARLIGQALSERLGQSFVIENRTGSASNIAAEHVARDRGAQVFPAMLSGEAQVYFGPLLSSIGYIRAGNLRALAVTSTTRSPELPEFQH